MSEPRTPGQIAYEAFAAAMTAKHAHWGMPAFADLRPAPDYQDAWESAAEAVLDGWQTAQQIDVSGSRVRRSVPKPQEGRR